MWLFLALVHLGYCASFTSVWQVNGKSIQLPLTLPATPEIEVDCGSITVVFRPATGECPFLTVGQYIITISTLDSYNLTSFNFLKNIADSDKIISITSWGNFAMTSSSTGSFQNCINLKTIDSNTQPIMQPGAVLASLFQGCMRLDSSFQWDLTNVVDISSMFLGVNQVQPVVFMNTGNITNMKNVFQENVQFFQDVSFWNVTNVLYCDNFCPSCLLPNFLQCSPCPTFGGSNQPLITSLGYSLCSCPPGASCYDSPFVSSWKIDSNNQSLTLPMKNSQFNFTVDWNDGNSSGQRQRYGTGDDLTHTYSSPGTYAVKIYGEIRGFHFQGRDSVNSNKLISIDSWGGFVVDNNSLGAFQGCTQLVKINAMTDQPQISGTNATMENFFANCSILNSALTWDLTNVISVKGMFKGCTVLNSKMSFITNSIQDFSEVFSGCPNFNQPVIWSGANAVDTSYMFFDAWSFNSSIFLSLPLVIDVSHMFENAFSFNQPLSFGVTTVNIKNMAYMFQSANAFNQNISFVTDNVEQMQGMFSNCANFNSYVNFTSTTNVKNMTNTFFNTSMKQNFAPWDTTNTADCSGFCADCVLPAFPLCTPCPSNSISKSRVCTCHLNEFPIVNSVCVKSSSSQGVGSLIPSRTLNITAGDVFISILPSTGYSYDTGGTVLVDIMDDIISPNLQVSKVVNITYFSANDNFAQTNLFYLAAPLMFSLPLQSDTNPDSVFVCDIYGQAELLSPQCAWLDDNVTWQTDNCTTFGIQNDTIQCVCYAPSLMVGLFAAVFPDDSQRIPPPVFKKLTPENLSNAPGGIIVVGIVLLMLLIKLLLSIRRDWKERKRGDQKAMKFEHWNQELAKWHWWRSLYPYIVGLQSFHTWFGLFYRKSGTNFRSVDRAVVTAFLIFAVMSISARFHQPDKGSQGSSNATLAVFPMWALVYLFTHTGKQHGYYEEWQQEKGLTQSARRRCFRYRFPERFRWVLYGVVFLCLLVMILYILFASLRFDQNPTYFCTDSQVDAWLTEFLIVYAAIIFLLEPAAIFVHVRFSEDRAKTAFLRNGLPPPAPAPSRVDRVEIEMNEGPLSKYAATSLPVTPIIAFSDIEITGPLGKGAFGRVDQCIWDGADCAIKRLLNPEAEVDFKREVDINRHLYAFKHQHVVNFIGITSNPPGMLLELYPLKSVEDYVLRGGALKGPEDLVNVVTVLIGGSAGVLHLHKHGVIHRDIASRNFLIKHDLSTAVCDFGLALRLPPDVTVGIRDLQERKSDMLPVNTTAPETLARGEFSPKSDVFMFGILIWELLARRQPHGDDKDLCGPNRDFPSFCNRILEGLRPTIAPEWPVELRNLMLACWAGDPSARPSMKEVNHALRAFRTLAETEKLALPPPVYVAPAVANDETNYYHHVNLVPEGSIYDTYMANPGFADHYFTTDKFATAATTPASEDSRSSSSSSSSTSSTSVKPPSSSASESIYTSYQSLGN